MNEFPHSLYVHAYVQYVVPYTNIILHSPAQSLISSKNHVSIYIQFSETTESYINITSKVVKLCSKLRFFLLRTFLAVWERGVQLSKHFVLLLNIAIWPADELFQIFVFYSTDTVDYSQISRWIQCLILMPLLPIFYSK